MGSRGAAVGTCLQDLLEDLEGGRLAWGFISLLVLLQHLVDLRVGQDLRGAARQAVLGSTGQGSGEGIRLKRE